MLYEVITDLCDIGERRRFGDPLRMFAQPGLDGPGLPDEQVGRYPPELAHHHGIERKQEKRNEKRPRQGKPEFSPGHDLQASEHNGEGKHLDDQDDRPPHDIRKLEEVKVEDSYNFV